MPPPHDFFYILVFVLELSIFLRGLTPLIGKILSINYWHARCALPHWAVIASKAFRVSGHIAGFLLHAWCWVAHELIPRFSVLIHYRVIIPAAAFAKQKYWFLTKFGLPILFLVPGVFFFFYVVSAVTIFILKQSWGKYSFECLRSETKMLRVRTEARSPSSAGLCAALADTCRASLPPSGSWCNQFLLWHSSTHSWLGSLIRDESKRGKGERTLTGWLHLSGVDRQLFCGHSGGSVETPHSLF